MNDFCKHKGAADSINWFVNLVPGKHRADHRETIKVLSDMLNQMKANNCSMCSIVRDCHELDKAMKAISDSSKSAVFVSTPAVVGPLTVKREHARKTRLFRPSGR